MDVGRSGRGFLRMRMRGGWRGSGLRLRGTRRLFSFWRVEADGSGFGGGRFGDAGQNVLNVLVGGCRDDGRSGRGGRARSHAGSGRGRSPGRHARSRSPGGRLAGRAPRGAAGLDEPFFGERELDLGGADIVVDKVLRLELVQMEGEVGGADVDLALHRAHVARAGADGLEDGLVQRVGRLGRLLHGGGQRILPGAGEHQRRLAADGGLDVHQALDFHGAQDVGGLEKGRVDLGAEFLYGGFGINFTQDEQVQVGQLLGHERRLGEKV
ncbi:Uncharacterised protein [uncultured archaeon]|nr:Uncharacterised protein [uncultured archaeon]